MNFKITRLLAIFIIAIGYTNPLAAIDIDDTAPNFELTTIDGKKFRLSDFQGKKPVYIIFWATWCHICTKEIPAIKKIHQQLSEQLAIIAINVGQNDSIKNIKSYQQKHQLIYPLAFDQGSKISRLYQVIGTPWQLVIDINGKIKYRSYQTPYTLAKYMAQLNKLTPQTTQGSSNLSETD